MSTDRSKWFRVFTPRPDASLRLVCFPHAGGAASSFRSWAELLPSWIELVAVQYPGRQDRFMEPHVEDIATLADQIAFTAGHRLAGPVAFFGHSLGATVAYETALRVERQPEGPRLTHLFASARRAPALCGGRLSVQHDDEALMAYVRALGGSGAGVLEDAELRELALPTLRADFKLVEEYRHVAGARVACPVTAVVGDRDTTFTLDDAAAWRDHTQSAFAAHTLPGGHFYLEETAPQLVELLAHTLNSTRKAVA
ncbi:thioesterase II family protein [Streptomyces sp. NPDC055189]